MHAATIAAIAAIAVVFIALTGETVAAIIRQQRHELYLRAMRRADLVAAHREAARKAENFLTVQHHAGDDSPATQLARDGWLEAAWYAPAADVHPIRRRGRSLR